MCFIVLCSSVSTSIPTPHHLSWLALQAYHSLFSDTKVIVLMLYSQSAVLCVSLLPPLQDQLPDYVRKLIEFRLLLCSIEDSSTTSSVSITVS